jgi:hypothetical protein
MVIGNLSRHLTRSGLAAFVIAVSVVLMAITSFSATAGRSAQGCTNSTHSIKQLAMIDHTSDGGYQCLGVAVEGDTVKAIRLERHTFPGGPGGASTEQVKVVEYPTTIIDSRHGAVIDGVPGHDAIVLHGHFSTPPGNGELVISYLYNGLTGEYHSCEMALDRTPNAGSGWRLVNRSDQTISLIMVRLRAVPMFGVIGIDNLGGACT